MNEKELLDLQEEIKEVENNTAELNGEKKALLRQFKKDYDCDSVEEVVELAKSLRVKANKMQKRLDKTLDGIEKKLKTISDEQD